MAAAPFELGERTGGRLALLGTYSLDARLRPRLEPGLIRSF
jgi:hypothetical protein